MTCDINIGKGVMEKLSAKDIQQALEKLEGWVLNDTGLILRQKFKFKNFNQAFSFMTAIALEAEKKDHHPDWSNSYDQVEISLSTHSAGGITLKDIELAAFINNQFKGQKLS